MVQPTLPPQYKLSGYHIVSDIQKANVPAFFVFHI